tara:strand:- start:316 stop:426 length:111 start_codon:yes stop_codon:yes gene_type:complete
MKTRTPVPAEKAKWVPFVVELIPRPFPKGPVTKYSS